MWWINRLYLDGVGHEESFYKHMTLDLHVDKDGDSPQKHINHTYLQLVNGGGKTTLISFFLTLFEPRKDQFVQVVSGRLRGNKYHYNHYFHPELSTLLMELVNQKGQRLLLGQFHQKINDETEVVSFVCDEPPNLFDLPFNRVPSRSRAEQQPEMKPFVGNLKLAREWLKEQVSRQDGLGHHWREAHTQADWHASLKELGINIDMIKTMVTLNSEEGGIKKFASYQSERDFLSSFYGCVIARNNLDSLINACQQEVKRGAEIKMHRKDEGFYEQLFSKWKRFVQPAEAHLEIRRSMSLMEEKFKEALRDLRNHVAQLSHSETQSKEEAKSKAEEIEQLNNTVQSLRLLKAELGYQAASIKCEQTQATLDLIDKEADQINETIQALESAEAYQQWVGAKADVEHLDHMCRLHREKHEKPLQEAFDRIAAQSLLIHQRALDNLKHDVASIEADLTETESAYKANQKHINETSSEIGSLKTERQNLVTQQKKGLDALEALKGQGLIEPSESPENAPIRWQKVVENDRLQYKRAKNALIQTETELAACELQLQQSHSDVERSDEQKQQAIRERDAAIQEYERLSHQWATLPDSVHERTSSDPLEWNAHRVEVQFTDWLKPIQADVQAILQRRSAQQNAYDELKAAGHQLLSSSVNLALSKLHDEGVPVDKVWAFPKYLAQVFQDDPAKIANKVDTDPGRYMGIVVLDEATLVRVKDVLGQIEWKDRPIPIFLARADDLSEISSSPVPDCVISPQDKLLYSEKATQDKLVELNSEIDSLTGLLEESQEVISELQAFQAMWLQYYRTYGKSWSTRHQRVHDTGRVLKQCIEAAERAEKARDAQKVLYGQSLKDEKHAEQLLGTSSEHLKAVESFLSREWQDYRSAQQTLPGVKAAITNHERKKQQLGDKGDQLSEKKTNLLESRSRLGVKRDTWSRRIEGTLYNQVAPAAENDFSVSPDDAHSKTEKAAYSLEQARSNEDIQSLLQKLEQAQHKQDKYYQALNKTTGWHHQQKRVMHLADSAPEELARQYREGQAELEKTQKRSRTAAVRLEHLNELLLTASNNRPENPPTLDDDIMGSVETLEKEQQAVGQRLLSTQQSLAVAKDSLKHLQANVNEWTDKITLCKAAIVRVEGVHSVAANGLPQPVEDLEELDQSIQEQKRAYDEAKTNSEGVKAAAESEWNKVTELTTQELAKEEEFRAANLFLRHWQGQTFQTALMNLDGLTRTIEDFYTTTQDLIARIHQSMEIAVRDLEGHLDRAVTLLKRAKRVKIPDSSTVLPGRAVLRIDDCVDRADIDLNTKARECLERWMRDGKIPTEKGQRDALTTDLVQSVFPEGHLDIRLIKTTTASSHVKYTPIQALEGSGGQLLTTAFLLYVTVAKVREIDNNMPPGGFLCADNPLGECNADSLLRIQMAMADAYNIQLIYLSGHTDPNAKSMFQNHLLLNKVGKLKNKELVCHLNDKHLLWNANLLAKPQALGAEPQ